MSWKLFALLALVGPSVGRLSPHADVVQDLMSETTFVSRISNDVIEDSRLDVPDLVVKYKYPLEKHQVVTSDGYILEVHRIPYGRHGNSPYRPVVLMMHGLFSSSADWVLMGPESAFAYILADSGFDVWMGNARGNYYSRKHTTLHSNLQSFWNFGWEEIGTRDLPAMIDYALSHTGQRKLHYIGHGQGSTAFFVMGSLMPKYNEKIASMQALAPIAYMANSKDTFLQGYATNTNIGEFVSTPEALTEAGQAACRRVAPIRTVCDNILFLLAGWNEALINSTMLPVKLGHTPAGASIRQLAHHGQSVRAKNFRRFDYGTRLSNLFTYGASTPPKYDLSKVTAPVFLHYGNADSLVHDQDVDRLLKELRRPVGKFLVPDRGFGHLDFLWAVNAKDLIYSRIINLMWALNA